MNDNWLWSSYIGYDLRTDLEDVQRIEVVRGPGSVLYGTGAVSGVINIVTRARDAQTERERGRRQHRGWNRGARPGAGGVRFRRWRGDVDERAGEPLLRKLLRPRSLRKRPAHPRDHPCERGPLQRRNVDRAILVEGAGPSMVAQHSRQASPHRTVRRTILGDDRTRQRDTRAMVEAKFEPKLSDTLQSLTRAHANYYGYDGYFASIPELGGVNHDTYAGIWAGVEERLVYTPFRTLRITAGGELQNHFKADQFAEVEYALPASSGPIPLAPGPADGSQRPPHLPGRRGLRGGRPDSDPRREAIGGGTLRRLFDLRRPRSIRAWPRSSSPTTGAT